MLDPDPALRGILPRCKEKEKRNAANLVEVIQAEDIGKLPDQNLAEVLENVTGVQITRTAGVGTGVQIRGSNSNRVEVNGVSSVGAGNGRNGISFEDVNPAIIAAVEVTKASEAKTVEGSVGGTVNLRTIRPLDLTDTLLNVRIQGEDSSLSTEDISPRLSGAFGKKWDTDLTQTNEPLNNTACWTALSDKTCSGTALLTEDSIEHLSCN